jgi:hypothetical protein
MLLLGDFQCARLRDCSPVTKGLFGGWDDLRERL